MIKKYSEVIQLNTFRERYEYLKFRANIGQITFGCDRHINQTLYKSKLWKRTRDRIIIRDNGCDLAMDGYNIIEYLTVHHINPITVLDVLENNPAVYDPQNLICVSPETHNAIHFGNNIREYVSITRTKNDTSPWLINKKKG